MGVENNNDWDCLGVRSDVSQNAGDAWVVKDFWVPDAVISDKISTNNLDTGSDDYVLISGKSSKGTKLDDTGFSVTV